MATPPSCPLSSAMQLYSCQAITNLDGSVGAWHIVFVRQDIKPNCLQLALALIDQTSAANVANNSDNNIIINISCCTSHRAASGEEEEDAAIPN